MAIRQSITLTDTGITYSTAYGRIDNTLISLGSGLLQVTLNWFSDPNLAASPAGFKPCRVDKVTLPGNVFLIPNATFVSILKAACDNGTIVTPQDALKTALYILIQQQPAYESSTFV